MTRKLTPENMLGRRFDELVVLRVAPPRKKYACYLVRCDCGKKTIVRATDIGRRKKHCGCRKGENISKGRRVHGLSKHPLHAVWAAMLARCGNKKNRSYAAYGKRGIKVCLRWRNSFQAFWDDMHAGWERGLTLERVNNKRGYSPSNCRWATRTEQARNTRSSRHIDTPRGRMLVAEAAQISGLRYGLILQRADAKWPVDKLFIAPSLSNKSAKWR